MRISTLLSSVMLFASTCAVSAQDYPSRSITMVVPYAAGGPTDTVARMTADAMSRSLGQQIVVENSTGAGGTLGSGRVARADPDGYTILVHHIGMSTAPTLYRKLAYDPRTAFEPIGLISDAPMTVIARPDFKPTTLQEVVDLAKAEKDKLTFANAGIGAASHLCGMLFMSTIGAQLTTVPYKGNGPIMTDLIGKQIDLTCDQTTNTAGPINAKQVKAYVATSPERLSVIPDVPTAKEAGLPSSRSRFGTACTRRRRRLRRSFKS